MRPAQAGREAAFSFLIRLLEVLGTRQKRENIKLGKRFKFNLWLWIAAYSIKKLNEIAARV
jgi:hypothetical protein